MRIEVPKENWNEIQFLSWSEFKQMAPSILRLEVTRLEKIIQAFRENTEYHNSLVRARFALKQFIGCIEETEKGKLEETCSAYLRTAIMNMSLEPEGLDDHTKQTCSYVLDRLKYVYHRIRLIY